MSLSWFHMAPGHRSTSFAQLNSYTIKCTFKQMQLVGQNQQKVAWKGGTHVSCNTVLLSSKWAPKHAGQLLSFIRGFPRACSMKVLLCSEMKSIQWGLLKIHLSGGKRGPKQCKLSTTVSWVSPKPQTQYSLESGQRAFYISNLKKLPKGPGSPCNQFPSRNVEQHVSPLLISEGKLRI